MQQRSKCFVWCVPTQDMTRLRMMILSWAGVAATENKMRENKLKWLEHVNQKYIDNLVRRYDYVTKA